MSKFLLIFSLMFVIASKIFAQEDVSDVGLKNVHILENFVGFSGIASLNVYQDIQMGQVAYFAPRALTADMIASFGGAFCFEHSDNISAEFSQRNSLFVELLFNSSIVSYSNPGFTQVLSKQSSDTVTVPFNYKVEFTHALYDLTIAWKKRVFGKSVFIMGGPRIGLHSAEQTKSEIQLTSDDNSMQFLPDTSLQIEGDGRVISLPKLDNSQISWTLGVKIGAMYDIELPNPFYSGVYNNGNFGLPILLSPVAWIDYTLLSGNKRNPINKYSFQAGLSIRFPIPPTDRR